MITAVLVPYSSTDGLTFFGEAAGPDVGYAAEAPASIAIKSAGRRDNREAIV